MRKRRSAKAVKTKKKVLHQQRIAKVQKAERGVMAIVPLSEITKPEMHKGKYSLTSTLFSQEQIKAIIAPTPQHIIANRPGKGGGIWSYVPGWWFKKKLNFVFGFSHDFEILGERVDGDFITVKGKITVHDPKTGRTIATKTDFGGAEIKYRKGGKQPLDIGNDFKAAATDAFKRCAVQFGFAMDVYGKSEAMENNVIVQNDTLAKPAAPKAAKAVWANTPKVTPPEAECHECGNPMTTAEATYSKKFFKGKQLCRGCQVVYKNANQ